MWQNSYASNFNLRAWLLPLFVLSPGPRETRFERDIVRPTMSWRALTRKRWPFITLRGFPSTYGPYESLVKVHVTGSVIQMRLCTWWTFYVLRDPPRRTKKQFKDGLGFSLRIQTLTQVFICRDPFVLQLRRPLCSRNIGGRRTSEGGRLGVYGVKWNKSFLTSWGRGGEGAVGRSQV